MYHASHMRTRTERHERVGGYDYVSRLIIPLVVITLINRFGYTSGSNQSFSCRCYSLEHARLQF